MKRRCVGGAARPSIYCSACLRDPVGIDTIIFPSVHLQNCRTFKELYGKLEGITAPEVVDSLTTKRVLVMEWIEVRRAQAAAAPTKSRS